MKKNTILPRSVQRRRGENWKVPRRVQQLFPMEEMSPEGILRLEKGLYSKTYSFEDVNYLLAAGEERKSLFSRYSNWLSSMEPEVAWKVSVVNVVGKPVHAHWMEPVPGQEGHNRLRKEYRALLDQTTVGAPSRERYITLTVRKESLAEAKAAFLRLEAQMESAFTEMGSVLSPLDGSSRLQLLGQLMGEDRWEMDAATLLAEGRNPVGAFCPDSARVQAKTLQLGNRWARVYFLREYGSFLKDTFLMELLEVPAQMSVSMDFVPVSSEEAIRLAEHRLLGVETAITRWQQGQNLRENYTAQVPFDYEQQRKEMRRFLEDLTARDQRMLLTLTTVLVLAKDPAQLEQLDRRVESVCRKHLVRLSPLAFQQLEGLQTVLPLGLRKVEVLRTLTGESAAALMPFRVQELTQEGGVFYGRNCISGSPIFLNRDLLLNGNGFVLGVPGSGKSFMAKQEMLQQLLQEEGDVLIIDPEREYGPLVRQMGGQILPIGAGSSIRLNAMTLDRGYGEEGDPISLKSEFLLSLFELLMNGRTMGPQEKSILDRCTKAVYRYYLQGGFTGEPLTLQDLYDRLLQQPEPEAKELALALELFTKGSLDLFAHPTNCSLEGNLLCFDIHQLSKPLQTIGMLVVLDTIYNRIVSNRLKGRKTFVYIDEIYLLLQHGYSASFLFRLWKRVRKYGAVCTGMTQNVEDLLQSAQARTMLSNSELLVLLNQAPQDRAILAELLSISPQQAAYITNAPAGTGLLKVGNNCVPFQLEVPKETTLYRLMTTKPGEGKRMTRPLVTQ